MKARNSMPENFKFQKRGNKMKRIYQTLFVAVAVAIFIFAAEVKTSAQYTQSNECSREMAEETEKFIRNSKISFKGTRSEFYSNKDERIYILSSETKINVSTVKPSNRIVAVINYKAENKNAGVYLVESEFRKDSINYRLKRESEVLYRFSVKLIGQLVPWVPNPPSDPFCDNVNNQNQIFLAQLQQQANQTCTVTGACIQGCSNGQMNGQYIMYRFEPQNPACAILTNPNQQQLRIAFDKSVQRDSALFTFSDKN